MIKRILSIFLVGVLSIGLAACGGAKEKQPNKTENTKQEKKEEVKNSETQANLNEKIKKEAVKADFVKINNDEMKNKSVFIEGEVSVLNKEETMPKFIITAKENDGFGIYSVLVIDRDSVKGLSNGDIVLVYGGVMDREKETGMPTISGNIIEKK